MYTRLYMGDKLYWRIKKDGKWTWKAVSQGDRVALHDYLVNRGEEE